MTQRHTQGHGEEMHQKLCAYVLGEGDAAERAEVEAALAASAELRTERERLEATIGLVSGVLDGAESLSATATATLMSAATPAGSIGAAGPANGPAPRRVWYTSPWVGVAAGIGAITLVIWSNRSTDQLQDTDVSRLDRNSGLAQTLPSRDAERELGGLDDRLGEQRREREAPASTTAPVAGLEGLASELAKEQGAADSSMAVVQAPAQDAQVAEEIARTLEYRAGIKNETEALVALVDEQEPNLRAFSTGGINTNETVISDNPVVVYGKVGLPSEGSVLDQSTPRVMTVLSAEQGGTYRGPGDTLPAGGGDGDFRGTTENFFLGRGELRRESSALASEPAAPGSAGPSTPGPAGPAGSPGPATGTSRPVEHRRGAGGGGGAPVVPGTVEPRSRVALRVNPVRVNEVKKKSKSSASADTKNHRYKVHDVFKGLGYAGGVDPDTDVDFANDLFRGGVFEELESANRQERLRRMTPEQLQVYIDHCTRRIVSDCTPRQNETPSMMFFRFWGDNAFEIARLDKLSTFSVDVDTASYALARKYLLEGVVPEKAQIRTEEFVNYFKPDVPAPTDGVFAIHTDLTPSRFGGVERNGERWMMRVAVRGREVSREERAPVALTFVIDTSGSMKKENRMELVKDSLRLLAAELDGNDFVTIIRFSNEAHVVLEATSAGQRGVIEAAVQTLVADGGTNADAGLRLGYEHALQNLNATAHNRVVLLSDGVANIGQTDQDRINTDVKNWREQGIYLNTVGVGMGNHNDVFLEQLADKGDGMCNYVDSRKEARRALVENFTGAFEPIARDVKIQVEFDPSQVQRYRLLGYENRAIADADFRNDKVDAGEIGAGHQVCALYELEGNFTGVEQPIATVRLRWKAPRVIGDPLPAETLQSSAVNPVNTGEVTEIEHAVHPGAATSFEAADAGYKRAVCVAQFAEFLRRSVHTRGESYEDLIAQAEAIEKTEPDAEFSEFVTLLHRGRQLILKNLPLRDDLARTIDAIRRHTILRAEYDLLQTSRTQEVLDELERENQRLEGRIKALLHGLIQEEIK